MNTALQLYNGQLSLISKPLPKISNINDVILKVSYSGVCQTDLSIISGKISAAKKVIQGHEVSGVITDVGKSVNHLKIGDRVCVSPFDYCAECHYCIRGHPQYCINDGLKTALGYYKDGGWQEYCIVASHLCFVLPSTMPLKHSVFCQPFSKIVQAWDTMGKVEHDARILITGAGIHGLFWASLLHYYGYRDVAISDISEKRKNMAARLDLGFEVVHPKTLNAQYEKSRDDEAWGFDVIIECTGNKRAVEVAFTWLRNGATIILFDVCAKGTNVDFEPYEISKKGIQILSTHMCSGYVRTVQLVHNMSDRYLNMKKLDIAVYSLHDYQSALDALKKGEITKAVFQF